MFRNAKILLIALICSIFTTVAFVANAGIPLDGAYKGIAFSAISAGAFEAALLGCELGAASFVIDRTTRNNERTITTVRLIFAPGYRIDTEI